MNELRTVGGMDARRFLGLLHLCGVAPLFLAAGIVTIATVGGGVLSGEEEVLSVTALVAGNISFLLMIIAIPGIITGIGLLRDASWAPALSLVMAFFTFLAIPVGTVISILTFWIFRDDFERMLARE